MSDDVTARDDRLRELAQAVRGEHAWAARMEPMEHPVDGGPQGRWQVVSAREEFGYPVETLCVLNFEHPYGGERRTAEFIAAASPDVVLGLLDRLAAVEAERDRLAAVVERVKALANKWQDGFRHKSGPFVRGEGDCSDDLRALIPADSTALDQVRAQAKAEGLREAAEWVIGCEHVSSMKWCGICQQWATALNDEADRIGSAL